MKKIKKSHFELFCLSFVHHHNFHCIQHKVHRLFDFFFFSCILMLPQSPFSQGLSSIQLFYFIFLYTNYTLNNNLLELLPNFFFLRLFYYVEKFSRFYVSHSFVLFQIFCFYSLNFIHYITYTFLHSFF